MIRFWFYQPKNSQTIKIWTTEDCKLILKLRNDRIEMSGEISLKSKDLNSTSMGKIKINLSNKNGDQCGIAYSNYIVIKPIYKNNKPILPSLNKRTGQFWKVMKLLFDN